MMKGLLYKEFYLTRKTYLGFLGLALGTSLLCILVCISLICGNLKEWPVESPEEVKSFFSIFVYTPFVMTLLATEACSHSIYADYAAGWMKYSYTLPTTAVKAMGVRYLAVVIILGACTVYGVLNARIISVLMGETVSTGMIKNMLLILVCGLAYNFLQIPLALKYKTAQAVNNRIIVVLVAAYILFGVNFMRKTLELDVEESDKYMIEMMEKAADVRDIVLPLLPVLLLVLFSISFFLSVKLYQRREK